MSLGLEGAYGNEGLYARLRQQVMDRIAEQQRQTQNDLQLRASNRADRQQQILEQEHAATLAERSRTLNETLGEKTATNLGPGQTVLSPSSPTAQTLLRAPSLAPLVQADQTLPSTQIAGGATLPGSETPDAVAPEATAKPSVLTGQLRFMGTPAANAAERKRTITGQLIASLPKGSPERLSLEYQQATGVNPPAGVFDKPTKPGEIKDTSNGLVRVGDDNSVTPLGISGYHPAKDTSAADSSRLDRSYQLNNKQLVDLAKPLEDQAERIGRLSATMNQHTPQADALIAPELLTAMAGGAGSGLRMNEAEIARIVGGRSKWESLKAALNQWSLDPKQALSVTDEQRTQMRDLVKAVADRGKKRMGMIDDAFKQLIDAEDVKTHRSIVGNVRKALADESFGQGTTTGAEPANATETWVRDANGKLVKSNGR